MTPGLKKAALRIHSLREKDRQWILQALPARQRASIESMLAQLANMDIPHNETWIESEKAGVSTTSSPVIQSNEDLLLMVDLFNVTQIRPVLDQMPENIVVVILSIHDWHWREQYLSKLKIRYRNQYENGIGRLKGRISSKVQFSLLKNLVDKVESALTSSTYKVKYPKAWLNSRREFVEKWSQ